MISLTENPIDVQSVIDQAAHAQAGAVNVFIGAVRNQTQQKEVVRLEYEAYDPMAIKEIEKIVATAKTKWSPLVAAVTHRKGILYPEDIAVVVAVATPHRQASFEACQYIIDTLKETVPIWKKEVFSDGEEWVSAHP